MNARGNEPTHCAAVHIATHGFNPVVVINVRKKIEKTLKTPFMTKIKKKTFAKKLPLFNCYDV